MSGAARQTRTAADERQTAARTRRPLEPERAASLTPGSPVHAPPVATPANIEHLQRTAGNQAVQQLLAQREPETPAPTGTPGGGVVQRHTGSSSDGLAASGQANLDAALHLLGASSTLAQGANVQVGIAKSILTAAHSAAAKEPAGTGKEEMIIPAAGGI